MMTDFTLWLFRLIPDTIDLFLPLLALGFVFGTASTTYYLLGVTKND